MHVRALIVKIYVRSGYLIAGGDWKLINRVEINETAAVVNRERERVRERGGE